MKKNKSIFNKYLFKKTVLFLTAFFALTTTSCDEAKNLLDLGLNPPLPKTIDKNLVGVNNFFVDPGFGSIGNQYADIRNNLGLGYVRVLFAWTTSSQPTPSSPVSVDLYDNILAQIPSNVDVLIVVTNVPDWFLNPANYIDGNPRKTFVEKWLKPLVKRYANNPRVIGWEIWNEPDLTLSPANGTLGLEDPAKYMELLQLGYQAVRELDPSKKVVMAATQSIQQKFPETINYNQKLKDLGAENYTDIWNVHYYGRQYENVARNGGVDDFLNGISKPIWVTEIGREGLVGQQDYAQTTIPFLKDQVGGIERFYIYQYSNTAPEAQNYGLRQPGGVSDLYRYLESLN